MRALLVLCTLAAPAWAQPFDCQETVALAKSAGAFVSVVNTMTHECQEKVATDQTCQTYVTAIRERNISENLLAFSARAAALAVRCPTDD